MSRNGTIVREFEEKFAARVRARWAIAMTNGTVTLEVALRALHENIGPGWRVGTSPLTMSATSLAICATGATPFYRDVDPDTWLMQKPFQGYEVGSVNAYIPVSLYGLHQPHTGDLIIDDAAQTLRPHGDVAFTSYSLQSSKILQTHEGGVLVTNDEYLAMKARSIASLGYDLEANSSRIDASKIKSPSYVRHIRYGLNARMNDATARLGLEQLARADELLKLRRACAIYYSQAIQGCEWIQKQAAYVDDAGVKAKEDYWCFAIALESEELWIPFRVLVEHHGGEVPYPAWRLSFEEPALYRFNPGPESCKNARSLQPRLVQGQTNNIESASRNADAWAAAIKELNG